MTSKIHFLFLLFLSITQNGLCQNKTAVQRINDSTIVVSDGVPLFLKISGKGAVCIFVHGGPGAWSKSFEKLGGDVLEDKLTMCYYDQRGCGRSASSPNNDYGVERMIQDIEDIRTALNTPKVYIMGHSFGGILATKYAEKYPDHVKGLILLNATLALNNSILHQISFMRKTLGETTPVQNKESLFDTFLEAKKRIKKADLDYKILSDNKDNIEKLDRLDSSIKRNYSFAQQAFNSPVYLADFTKDTPAIKVPVLIVTGSKDNSVGPDHYRLFKFPNQEIKIINGGHFLYYENNKEFKDTVQAFVQKTSSKF